MDISVLLKRVCFKGISVPVISRFFGIVITMYWDDHNPAHFHAKYGEYEAVVEIKSGIVSGKFQQIKPLE